MEGAHDDVRIELLDGVVYAMGRGTFWHAVMTSAISRALGNALPKGCRTAAESCAVGIAPEQPTYVHPDVTVVCGAAEYHPDEDTVIMNPTAVIEVLSKGTALRDRNDKLPKYKAMPSLEVIVYFDHTKRQATAYLRTARGWEEVVVTAGPLELGSLGLTLDVTALYDEAATDGGP